MNRAAEFKSMQRIRVALLTIIGRIRDTMTCKRRRTIAAVFVVVILYFGGLVLGYRRLAWVAIKNVGIKTATVVTIDRNYTSISRSQEQYLKQRLTESTVPTTPRIHVQIIWNAFICSRVKAGYYVGPLGAEWKDTLFICMFGAWVPVHTFSDLVA